MPEKRLDPRDLISPPWRTCPACGKDKFGVSIISGSRLMRRCRDCWHQRDYRLPELRKKIIYLDQFVISNLMKLENPVTQGHATVAADPFWRELENRIADAPFVKLQSLMFAAIAIRAAQGQKEPPNKGTATDIDTGGAPVTLLRCDIRITAVDHCCSTFRPRCGHRKRRRYSR